MMKFQWVIFPNKNLFFRIFSDFPIIIYYIFLVKSFFTILYFGVAKPYSMGQRFLVLEKASKKKKTQSGLPRGREKTSFHQRYLLFASHFSVFFCASPYTQMLSCSCVRCIDYTEFIAATVEKRSYMQDDILWGAFRVNKDHWISIFEN